MNSAPWVKSARLTVPDGDSVVFSLPTSLPMILDKLVIWAYADRMPLTALTFQARINGVNFGPSVAHAGPGPLALCVFRPVVGTATEGIMFPSSLPQGPRGDGSVYPFRFVFDVLVTSAHTDPQEIQMTALARGLG